MKGKYGEPWATWQAAGKLRLMDVDGRIISEMDNNDPNWDLLSHVALCVNLFNGATNESLDIACCDDGLREKIFLKFSRASGKDQRADEAAGVDAPIAGPPMG